MTYYPNAIDDSTSLPPGMGGNAMAINALIAAVQAVEIELGILPSGVYATVRTRLDILEARINNPYAPAPNVTNPFFIGNDGVTISTGDGAPTSNMVDGSLYLRMDGTSSTGVYTHQDGYWSVLGAAISGNAGGDLSGMFPDPSVIALDGYPLAQVAPTVGQVLMWDGSFWTPSSVSGSFAAGGDLSGTSTDQTVIGLQTIPVSSTSPTTGQTLFFDGAHWTPYTSFNNVYNCPTTVSVGDAVYGTGPDSVDRAQANSISTVPAIGFVLAKPTTTTASVQYFGEVAGFSGLSTGSTYYLSDTVAGGITTTAPSTTGFIVQKVGFAKDSTTLVAVVNREFVQL